MTRARPGAGRGPRIALAALLACACARAPSAPRRPISLLLVTIDTLRADAVGSYGRADARTPALDALAARGVRFADCTSPVPLTLPAHATLFTGLLPARHGVHVNGDDRLPAGGPLLLAERLGSQGYDTAAVIGAFALAAEFGLARGFSSYDDHLGEGPLLLAAAGQEAERRADEVASRAETFLRAPRARPFFLWVHFYDPHAPYDPPAALRQGSDARSRYLGEVAAADAGLARVLAALEASGRASRTLVVVTSDHGEGLGEHGEEGHGVFLYETTLRVPLVMALEGALPATVISSPVGLVDLLPTLLELLELPLPAELDGASLLPLVRGGKRAPAPLVAESRYAERSFGWAPLHALRQGSDKFIQAPRPELYDLARDPGELRNLAPGAPEKNAALAEQLAGQLAGAPLRIERAALDPEAAEKLASLGYLGAVAVTGREGVDPKDGLPTVRAMTAGLEAFARGDLATATARFRDAARAEPTNPSAHFQLGRALLGAGELVGARGELEAALALDPRLASAWEALGACAEREGDLAGAAAIYARGLEQVPAHARLELRRGVALLRAGQVGEALASLERASGQAPDKADAWMFLGEGRVAAGDRPGAVAAYEQAARILPGAEKLRRRLDELRAASPAPR